MKLLICVVHPFDLWRVPGWFSDRLRADFPQLTVVHLPDYKGLDQEVVDADILINWNLRPQQFRAAKKLRWIHSTAAAVHALMFPELINSDVVVTNARDVHGPVVAEHAMALVFACAKRLRAAARYQQQHTWAQDQLWHDSVPPREIAGGTLGILGYGSIGRPLASMALALGMRVLALREHPDAPLQPDDLSPHPKSQPPVILSEADRRRSSSAARSEPEGAGEKAPYTAKASASFGIRQSALDNLTILGPSDLPRLLHDSEYVVLAAPITGKTRKVINAERLALMRPDAYLINVSRGELIEEPALIEALRRKSIAGAALDVTLHEPLPPDSPFWDFDNLLLTPHSAALTARLWERNYALFADNLRRFLAGQPLLYVVDKSKGY